MAGDAGYEGGFIEHYITGLLYPRGLTMQIQVLLGIAVVTVNVVAYTLYWRRRHRSTTETKADAAE
jgi:hypothetical protein